MGGGGGVKRKTFVKKKAKNVIFALLINTVEKQKMDEIGMIMAHRRRLNGEKICNEEKLKQWEKETTQKKYSIVVEQKHDILKCSCLNSLLCNILALPRLSGLRVGMQQEDST
jgi:ABC-type phosphate/phosphonate transport system substrate-binding protein